MAPLRIAVLHQEVQLSDITGIDIFGNISKKYIAECTAAFPVFPNAELLASQATEMQFLFVADTLEPTEATPGIKILPTHTYASCPVDDVDIMLIGGPLPHVRPAESLKLIRRFCERGESATLMTTCVGSLWAAASGVLEGRRATTNRGALVMARHYHGEAEWVDKRWVVDEAAGKVKLWTSGGAGAGLDMIQKYCFEKFGREIVEQALFGLDYEVNGRGEEYKEKLPEAWGGEPEA
ncbi:uncharacterized protein HMPREF1541_05480 [Cyphellophora europaea CBS 101466]|uniref:DJ-1/PfpI domain-containing protein n=1 Tax=Cyphellophora europaea (strain CBS 101466) TaxID=1220924 RepID=W2RS22_CYPE1|nr:uncharacterized protein HMPREF1541_05480 [Cyphellophora europaea CBS 101466]ETN39257.1 hypothetical protein HMPREF1541_05480 [Cyphellophora europaea CBS 101466]